MENKKQQDILNEIGGDVAVLAMKISTSMIKYFEEKYPKSDINLSPLIVDIDKLCLDLIKNIKEK
jgi:hypothetical protein